jgi:dTDP-4-amino-4,6-dideoxygalactose transaminase
MERRRQIAASYDDVLRTFPGLACFDVDRHEWNGALYTVRVLGGRREALRAHLSARGIETRVYYPRLLHQEPAFAEHRGGLRFPGAEALSREVLSLPLHPFLTDGQVTTVIKGVTSFWGVSPD